MVPVNRVIHGTRGAVDWRLAAWIAYVAVNLYFLLVVQPIDVFAEWDWDLWEAIPHGLATGTLYELDTVNPYVWSPVLAPVQAVIGLTGVWPAAVVTIGLVLLARDPWFIGAMYSSLMFWPTAMSGSVVFVLAIVAGFLGMRGSRAWALVFLAIAVMAPRPLFMPLAVWLLWKMPEVRLPFAWVFAVHAAIVLASGYAFDWVAAMLRYGGSPGFDMGPTAFIEWWLIVGVPLGLWLTWKGHPGWAGLAVSPYTIHGYVLMPLVELRLGLRRSEADRKGGIGHDRHLQR